MFQHFFLFHQLWLLDINAYLKHLITTLKYTKRDDKAINYTGFSVKSECTKQSEMSTQSAFLLLLTEGPSVCPSATVVSKKLGEGCRHSKITLRVKISHYSPLCCITILLHLLHITSHFSKVNNAYVKRDENCFVCYANCLI